MQVIIPMSGVGQRFIDAGYTTLKPLIPVEGKPIIEHVLERFAPDDDYLFICNEEHLAETSLEKTLMELRPKGKIVPIKPHKLGPVYAVLQAKEFINNDQPTIVNYCDFSWRWDYKHFKKTVMDNKCDGCVVSYRGFHPNLLGPNLYASMRDSGNGWMEEIREKYSFTENKMESYQSSGTYYFKDGHIVKKYFQELISQKTDCNGEYYVSLVYSKLKEEGLKVFIYEIPFFLQWGTPEDLEEYLYWSGYLLKEGMYVN